MAASDFNILGMIDRDVSGTTLLGQKKISGEVCAIKVLKKEFMYKKPDLRVFLDVKHQFILELKDIFESPTCIHMVMELASGGTLMWHVQQGRFEHERARFYAAEICLGIKGLHEKGIIHRDLSLDNIVMTIDGHVKIAGLELCKPAMWYGSTTSTFCGTSAFLAPEMVLDKPYGRAVDWWAFGIVIYQMLTQRVPFDSDDQDELFDAILDKEPLLTFPIVQQLLVKDPASRLGSSERDALDVMEHPFFEQIEWDAVYHQRTAAPFRPQLTDETDLSCFESAQSIEQGFVRPCGDW